MELFHRADAAASQGYDQKKEANQFASFFVVFNFK